MNIEIQTFLLIYDISTIINYFGGIHLPTKKRPITFEDLMRIERVSNPVVHPSGKFVAYVVTKHDHVENKVNSTIMLVNLNSLKKRELTPGTNSDSDPSWSPDGKLFAFVSDREEGKQLWILPFEDGGEAFQLTNGEGGVSKPVWSLDGTRIVYARSVIVSPHWNGNIDDIPEDKRKSIAHARTYGLVNDKSTARLETTLLYRHWDQWREMKRSHLFVIDISTKEQKDITLKDADVPPISLGGIQDYCFSPEGDEIAYVMNPDKVITLSTNNSIFLQKINGIKKVGKAKKISITKAMDSDPRYSNDGKYIVYLGAEKPKYESDRLRVKLYNRKTGKTTILTENFDRSANNLVWSQDHSKIFFLAPDFGYMNVYSVDIETNEILQYTRGSFNNNLQLVPEKGFLITRESAVKPADIYILTPKKGFDPIITNKRKNNKKLKEDYKKITDYGDWLGGELNLNALESFYYKGADKDIIHGFLLKPPGFKTKKKYPTILIIHGGPQSAFFDHFHYRWSPQLFASEGYVVIELNPRGSIGYGQKFTDQISGDWGGKCYEDIIKGLDFCIDNYSFIDKNRISAAGASFGGFMINWIAGHTDRFKALVSHDGIFNSESMAYMTEELWFEQWEHGGMPHEDHEEYLKYSPHMFVQNFKTPMLVIQGEQDFRCPVSEGISLFTALQVMDVPSKFLYFPDEGHWVLKPANSHVWYRTILDFIKEYGTKK